MLRRHAQGVGEQAADAAVEVPVREDAPELLLELRLELSLECFNVLNTDKTLTIENYYGRYRSKKWTQYSAYGKPLSIEAPRQFRAGVRLLF